MPSRIVLLLSSSKTRNRQLSKLSVIWSKPILMLSSFYFWKCLWLLSWWHTACLCLFLPILENCLLNHQDSHKHSQTLFPIVFGLHIKSTHRVLKRTASKAVYRTVGNFTCAYHLEVVLSSTSHCLPDLLTKTNIIAVQNERPPSLWSAKDGGAASDIFRPSCERTVA